MPDNICPVCKSNLDHVHTIEDPIWLNDPIKTPYGLAGSEYIGANRVFIAQIQQLQVYYGYIMDLVGLTPPTWLVAQATEAAYIIQLRVCIELILSKLDKTLEDYFASDKYGSTYSSTQIEWTDCERDDANTPIFPIGTAIKAIHLEELRRGTFPGLVYYLIFGTLSNVTDRYYGSVPTEGANIVEDAVVPTDGITGTFKGKAEGPVIFKDTIGQLYYLFNGNNQIFSIFDKPGTGSEIYTDPLRIFPAAEDATFWQNNWIHSLCIGPSKIVDEDTGDEDYRLYVLMCKLAELHWPGAMPAYPNNYPEATYYPYDSYLFPNIPYNLYEFRGIKYRHIGISGGGIGQSYNLYSLEGIDWDSLKSILTESGLMTSPYINKYFKILVNNTTWTYVADFSGSGPTDLHYTIDSDGVLQFNGSGEGEAQVGAIPAAGAEIRLWMSPLFANKNRWIEYALLKAADETYSYEFPQCFNNSKLIISKVKRRDVGYIDSQLNETALSISSPTEPENDGYGRWVSTCSGDGDLTRGMPSLIGMGEFNDLQVSKDLQLVSTWGALSGIHQITGGIGSYSAWAASTASVGHEGDWVYTDGVWHYERYKYLTYLVEEWSFSAPSIAADIQTVDGHSIVGYEGSGSSGTYPPESWNWEVYNWIYRKTHTKIETVDWSPDQITVIKGLANTRMAERSPSIEMVFAQSNAYVPASLGNAAKVYWNKDFHHTETVTYRC